MAPLSYKITNLPLRPTTTATLLRRGFYVTSEIQLSKQSGGMGNLAAELGCSLSVAASIFREVEQAILSLTNGINSNESSSNVYQNRLNNPNSQNANLTNAAATQHSLESNNISGISAADLLRQQRKRSTRPIVTFCQSIDSLLGGGFATSEVTEVVGVPGVGKTQLAMQLCVDASIPKPHGGVEGEAVYIDSEGSFAPERCYNMAQSLVEHIRSSAKRRITRYQQSSNNFGSQSVPEGIPESYTSESILSGIHVFRVYDEAAQTATIKSLYNFLSDRKSIGTPVKIIVIDSIAFHYRSTSMKTNYVERTRSLAGISAILSDIATKYEVAVVVINHMTTKIEKNVSSVNSNNPNHFDTVQMNMDILSDNGSKLTPALGESWAHSTSTRMILTHEKNHLNQLQPTSYSLIKRRRCTLVKSPHKPAGIAFYCVLDVGIRDCPTSNSAISSAASPQKHQNNVQNHDKGEHGQASTMQQNQSLLTSKKSRISY